MGPSRANPKYLTEKELRKQASKLTWDGCRKYLKELREKELVKLTREETKKVV